MVGLAMRKNRWNGQSVQTVISGITPKTITVGQAARVERCGSADSRVAMVAQATPKLRMVGMTRTNPITRAFSANEIGRMQQATYIALASIPTIPKHSAASRL